MSGILYGTKKIVSAIISPLGAVLLLTGLGTLWLWRRPDHRGGKILVATGWLLLLITSLPVTGYFLIQRLEAMAGTYAKPAELGAEGIDFVVVLGGDARPGDLTPADQAACTSLIRVLEGIRLWKELPGARLVFSGGTVHPDIMPTAEVMGRVAKNQGIPDSAILLENRSWDTDDEARYLRPMLDNRRFLLVTSACHMPRALLTFRRYGMTPIPAPADFEAHPMSASYKMFLPSPNGLKASDKAFREYLGMTVVFVKMLFTSRE